MPAFDLSVILAAALLLGVLAVMVRRAAHHCENAPHDAAETPTPVVERVRRPQPRRPLPRVARTAPAGPRERETALL